MGQSYGINFEFSKNTESIFSGYLRAKKSKSVTCFYEKIASFPVAATKDGKIILLENKMRS
jgi:hypothetical protein